jgi:hypothetical protein
LGEQGSDHNHRYRHGDSDSEVEYELAANHTSGIAVGHHSHQHQHYGDPLQQQHHQHQHQHQQRFLSPAKPAKFVAKVTGGDWGTILSRASAAARAKAASSVSGSGNGVSGGGAYGGDGGGTDPSDASKSARPRTARNHGDGRNGQSPHYHGNEANFGSGFEGTTPPLLSPVNLPPLHSPLQPRMRVPPPPPPPPPPPLARVGNSGATAVEGISPVTAAGRSPGIRQRAHLISHLFGSPMSGNSVRL